MNKPRPNAYELPPDQLPPGRESVISEIENALTSNHNVAIVGEMMAGKSTLLRYCAQAELAGRKGMVATLSGIGSVDGFHRELKYVASRAGIDLEQLSADQPIAIYIDEFGYLTMFSEADQIEILDYMIKLSAAGQVNWVAACNIPVNELKLPENELFDTSLALEPPKS